MNNSDIGTRSWRCPNCHQRHLHKDQRHYVCENCQAVFAEAQFDPAVLRELAERLQQSLDTLDAPQRLQFKQAVVRQAISYVEALLPPEAEDDGHRSGIFLATCWLEAPTAENARRAAAGAAGECIDGGVRYFDYPEHFLDPAFVASVDEAWKAAQLARQTGVKADLCQSHFERIILDEDAAHVIAIAQYTALEWQIAAAQAILCAADLPPLN